MADLVSIVDVGERDGYQIWTTSRGLVLWSSRTQQELTPGEAERLGEALKRAALESEGRIDHNDR